MRGGPFREDDPGDVVDFVDRKLLRRSMGAKVLSRSTEGVRIRPFTGDLGKAERKAARQAWPRVAIYRPTLTRNHPRCYLWPGERVAVDQVPALLAAAGLQLPISPSSGGVQLEVNDAITAPQAVGLALAAMHACGAPGPAWEWEPIVEVDTSSIS